MEDMHKALAGAQPRIAGHGGLHKDICMQLAFHQHICLARATQGGGGAAGFFFACGVMQGVTGNIPISLSPRRGSYRPRPRKPGIMMPALVASSAASIGRGDPARAMATRGGAKALARAIRSCGGLAYGWREMVMLMLYAFQCAQEPHSRERKQQHHGEAAECRRRSGQKLPPAQKDPEPQGSERPVPARSLYRR